MMLDDGISRLCPEHSKILESPSRAPIRSASKQHLPQPILAAPTAEPALPPGWAASRSGTATAPSAPATQTAACSCAPAAAPT